MEIPRRAGSKPNTYLSHGRDLDCGGRLVI
jgi:hypothetical protein